MDSQGTTVDGNDSQQQPSPGSSDLVVANQLRTKLDLDHARQVITISRGLRRPGRLVVDRVKYTCLGIKPSFSLSSTLIHGPTSS